MIPSHQRSPPTCPRALPEAAATLPPCLEVLPEAAVAPPTLSRSSAGGRHPVQRLGCKPPLRHPVQRLSRSMLARRPIQGSLWK
ncbi:hypothetical protein SKAU_G00412440 [Synaphobranchus kaupii]|uniref:Uncharacterized protein n=1 Tax=Synaphobranchus kaupii TaxID=118154 RepID=A0A9Q1E817_SYNKA|nr:hypothetical protein SKAU_G00412440 [Synaphobranchus kaupii]